MTGTFTDWPVIATITRADLIATGDLIQIDPATSLEVGIRYPVALTAAAHADCVAWTDADNDRKGTLQDEAGRLWDVLWMASNAIRRTPGSTDRVLFELRRVPRTGRGVMPRRVTLKAVIGPGDNGEPVIAVMQPNED